MVKSRNVSKKDKMDVDASSESDAAEIRAPSLLEPGVPLTHSYSYFAPVPTAAGPYVLGIDEAGRGPALGPMVYGVAWCPEAYVESTLNDMGFDDSKVLSADTRSNLLQSLCGDPESLGWGVRVLSPSDISAGMLSKPPTNLNRQAELATITLIKTLLQEPYSLDISAIFVDALGASDKYQTYLSSLFPGIDVTVKPKADSIYKIVGAASVAAKVTRDAWMEGDNWVWENAEAGNSTTWSTQWGSGYPSDPTTKAWISNNLEKTFGYPPVARFSWAPIRNSMEQGGHTVEWIDEGQKSLMKAFDAVLGNDKGRSMITKDLSLRSVAAL